MSLITPSSYITIAREVRFEITIKRSVFLACCFPIQSKQGAMDALSCLRTEFHTAVHHCWAYRIGATGMEYRMSDDGEPSGSAGKPILFCLQKSGLSDVMIVVARWFGGVRLGVGGLARAYTEAAQGALAVVERVHVIETVPLSIHCGYDDVSVISTVLDERNLDIAPVFSDAVIFEVNVPKDHVSEITNVITERTGGRAGVRLVRND